MGSLRQVVSRDDDGRPRGLSRRPSLSRRDRWFESGSLQRRVSGEPATRTPTPGSPIFFRGGSTRRAGVRSRRFAELEVVSELGTGLRLPCTNPRTETAARPHFLAQGPDQHGIFAETLDEDGARTFECSGRIHYPLVRFEISASHLLRALIGTCQKRLCQRLEACFACAEAVRHPNVALCPATTLP